ncbi:hypothetical protein JYU34_010061 [Plutella xylostella]|uniref:FP protein C-terminal domain-containing protein n=1 Tax=Plutella xylostella TaxID=51655 RepID=A0ABQ7QIG5_PLUXY|nr:hypothetical protein JYU34_010061 [Plutella xylostella]
MSSTTAGESCAGCGAVIGKKFPQEANVTLRSTTLKSKEQISSPGADIREIIREEIRSALKSTLGEGNSLLQKLDFINDKMTSFESSLSFFNSMYEEFKNNLEEKSNLISSLQKENETLNSAVKDLSGRLNSIEQHMREDNVELNGLPENKSENLCNTVVQLAKTVDCPINEIDIIHATRVAKQNKTDDRPRSIIIKLRTVGLRDSLLAAVQTFNKKNPKDKLSSHHLGIGGNNVPVYMSEHLSPANKALHAATRHKARELQYKYVWVRGGRILVRKNETSQAMQIRNHDSLKLMV